MKLLIFIFLCLASVVLGCSQQDQSTVDLHNNNWHIHVSLALPCVKEVTARNLNLEFFNFSKSFPNLETLDVYSSYLAKIEIPKTLQVLHFFKTKKIDFADITFNGGFTASLLQEIKFEAMDFTNFAPTACPDSLKKLLLIDTELTSIDLTNCFPESLDHIDLSRSQKITSIALTTLQKMAKKPELTLKIDKGCPFAQSGAAYRLPNSELTKIPNWITQLPLKGDVDFSGNSLTDLEFLSGFDAGTTVNVANNRIKNISSSEAFAIARMNVNLNGNPIKKIELPDGMENVPPTFLTSIDNGELLRSSLNLCTCDNQRFASRFQHVYESKTTERDCPLFTYCLQSKTILSSTKEWLSSFKSWYLRSEMPEEEPAFLPDHITLENVDVDIRNLAWVLKIPNIVAGAGVRLPSLIPLSGLGLTEKSSLGWFLDPAVQQNVRSINFSNNNLDARGYIWTSLGLLTLNLNTFNRDTFLSKLVASRTNLMSVPILTIDLGYKTINDLPDAFRKFDFNSINLYMPTMSMSKPDLVGFLLAVLLNFTHYLPNFNGLYDYVASSIVAILIFITYNLFQNNRTLKRPPFKNPLESPTASNHHGTPPHPVENARQDQLAIPHVPETSVNPESLLPKPKLRLYIWDHSKNFSALVKKALANQNIEIKQQQPPLHPIDTTVPTVFLYFYRHNTTDRVNFLTSEIFITKDDLFGRYQNNIRACVVAIIGDHDVDERLKQSLLNTNHIEEKDLYFVRTWDDLRNAMEDITKSRFNTDHNPTASLKPFVN